MVKRIAANIPITDPAAAQQFYGTILGLDLLMDHGWIQTYGSDTVMALQISFASEGGSGTPVPDLSIEVDDVDTVYHAMHAAGFPAVYGPATEPWGVYRFYVRDPFGKLVNILQHVD